MCVEGREHITDGETRRVGIRQDACDECAKPAFVVLRRVRLRRRCADERSHAAARLDDAGAFELRVDPRDRVGVDLEIHRELPDGWQLVPRTKPSCGDRGPEPAFELGVNRCPVTGVDGDDVHVTYCTRSLEQVLSSGPVARADARLTHRADRPWPPLDTRHPTCYFSRSCVI